jgi:NADH-quinone oxidoreductase subunit N
VFTKALDAGYSGLVILGVVTSLAGVYYYFRVLIAMFSTDTSMPPFKVNPEIKILLLLLVLLVLAMGLFPDFFSIF